MKKLIALVLAAAALMALIGCSLSDASASTGETPEPDSAPEEKAEINIAIASEPATLHPFDHSAVVCGYMNQMTYNKLFTTDVMTLEPVPELVESYTCSDDGLTWDFTLRKGVRFHDGSEMTAADAVASLEYASTFAYCTRYTTFWSTLEQTGDYTFRLTTEKPYSLALYDLTSNAACVLPKALIDEGHDFSAEPVGTGPYIFEERRMGDSVSFIKNDDYFDAGHIPTIDRMTWKVIPEGSSRTIGLETGELDLVIDVDQNDVKRLESEDGISVTSLAGTRISFMVMNSQRAPFDNISFRKAVNAAVDRSAVLAVAAGDMGEISISPNPQVFAGSTLENTTDYSPELASKYLEESGIDPESVTFTCLCYTDETRRAAEVIQGYLGQLGITMEIESMDFAAFLSNMLDGNFDCAVAGYSSTNMLTYMKGLWHSGSIGASNAARVIDPELDSLIELAETQLDDAARTETLLEICRRTNDLSLLLPLYTSSVTRAYSDRLGGVAVGPSGTMRYQDLYIIK